MSRPARWVKPVSIICLAVGGVLLIASFAISEAGLQRRQWSAEQAQRYTEAANRFHQQVHHAGEHRDDPAAQQQLSEARSEFEQMQADLQRVRTGPRYTLWSARICGLLIMVVGVVLPRAWDG